MVFVVSFSVYVVVLLTLFPIVTHIQLYLAVALLVEC